MNKRKIKDADFTASGANPLCGDRVRMYAKVTPQHHPELVSEPALNLFQGSQKMLNQVQHDIIEDCSFEGEGCAISTASAALLTEEAKGKSAEEIANWNLLTVNEWLGTELGPSRAKCGLLALETLQQALAADRQANSG